MSSSCLQDTHLKYLLKKPGNKNACVCVSVYSNLLKKTTMLVNKIFLLPGKGNTFSTRNHAVWILVIYS